MTTRSLHGRGPRILALHSFRTSGVIFETQLRISGLYRFLTQDLKAELTFVNAPHKASGPIPQDVEMAFSSVGSGEYYEWWNATLDEEQNTWHYENSDASLDYLQKVWKEHGGFDGIIGFSQGAAIAALFAAMLTATQMGSNGKSHHDDKECLAPPRFIVCISGIKVRDDRFVPYYRSISHLPSVHICGQHDPVKILTNQLVTCFASPVILTHDRGHVVPRLHDDMSKTLKNFVTSAMQDGNHQTSKF